MNPLKPKVFQNCTFRVTLHRLAPLDKSSPDFFLQGRSKSPKSFVIAQNPVNILLNISSHVAVDVNERFSIKGLLNVDGRRTSTSYENVSFLESSSAFNPPSKSSLSSHSSIPSMTKYTF